MTFREVLGPSGDSIGAALAGLGDFDGDGMDDYAASAPSRNVVSVDDGAVVVYSGATGRVLAEIPGPSSGFELGRSLASVGDVNGDGYADLIAGGLFHVVRVHLGPDGALLRQHAGTGTRPAVAGVGDMDHDGFDDYIVGWPQNSENGGTTGKAVVFSGRTGGILHQVHGETPASGPFGGDHLGRSVSGAGDVDGDGTVDFLVGAPFGLRDTFGAGKGYARVYSGADAHVIHEVESENGIPDSLGFKVSGGSDVNGDGVPDFSAGAPGDNLGEFFSDYGAAIVYSGASGEILWKPFGAGILQKWGFYVRVLADLDGDGFSEWGSSDGVADFAFNNAGRITIYSGAPGDVDRYCPSSLNSTDHAARLETWGPISVGNDDLDLRVVGLPPGQFGVFAYGTEAISAPFGDGTLCIGGSVFRVGDPARANRAGVLLVPMLFDEPPVNSGPGLITPGITRFLQCWYRDPAGPGGTGFNVSDALSVTFTP